MPEQKIELKDQAKQLRETKKDGGNRFLLSDADWYTVQTYCAAVQGLPISDAEIKVRFALLADDDVSRFSDLRDHYKTMYGHVQAWDAVVQDSVALANGISKYGRNAKDIYYKRLLELADKGLDDPKNKKEFLAILDNRAKEADEFAKKSKAIAGGVGDFYRKTSEDASKMIVLKEKYDKEYDNENERWKEVDKEVKDLLDDLQAANQEFNQACLLSGSRPWYKWLADIGSVVGGTFALDYGLRAKGLLNKMKDLNEKIGLRQGQLTRNTRIRASVKAAQDSVSQTKEKADKVQGSLGRMRSAWEMIALNLRDLATLVDQDIRKAEELVRVQLDEAVADWGLVGQQAEGYARNAYIEPPAEQKALEMV